MLERFAGFVVADEQAIELPPLKERLLVTFALIAYNQEKYIREAVEGAFAQTYEPLEIILSDDCSTDRTFEIMEEMADVYSGNHSIKLNKNTSNKGIGAHLNKIHLMANGTLIIHAAGDDISERQRTSILVQAYNEEHYKPSLIISNGIIINKEGMPIKNQISVLESPVLDRPSDRYTRTLPIIGCTAAISRELVLQFAPLPDGLIAEDALLYRRAYLVNGVKYIPNKLVKYRTGQGIGISSTKSDSPSEYIRYYLMNSIDSKLRWKQLKKDMESLKYHNINVLNDIDRQLYISEKAIEAITATKPTLSILNLIRAARKSKKSEFSSLLRVSLAVLSPTSFKALRSLRKKLNLVAQTLSTYLKHQK